jgi:hypothetical protein
MDENRVTFMIHQVSSKLGPITIEERRARVDRRDNGQVIPSQTHLLTTEHQTSEPELEVLDLVTTQSELHHPSKGWVRRSLWAVVAAAALVGGVCIAGRSLTGSDGTALDDQPASPATTSSPVQAVEVDPETLLRRYVDALNQRDSDAIEELLAADAVINEVPGGAAIDDYASHVQWLEILDWRRTITECETDGNRVTCSYDSGNALSDALGLTPTDTGEYRLTVDDGQISVVQNNVNMQNGGAPGMGTFRSWVQVNHPEVYEVMWPNRGVKPSYSPESLDLFRDLSAEFREGQTDS